MIVDARNDINNTNQLDPNDVRPWIMQMTEQDLAGLGYVTDGNAIGNAMPALGETGGLTYFYDTNGKLIEFSHQIQLPGFDRFDFDLLPGGFDLGTADILYRQLVATLDENRETHLQVENGEIVSAYYFYQHQRDRQIYGEGVSIDQGRIPAVALLERNDRHVLAIFVRVALTNGQTVDLPIPAPLWGQEDPVQLHLGDIPAANEISNVQYQFAFAPLNRGTQTQFSLPDSYFGLSLTATIK